jgi:glycosyltransferase involved in cell wall biosynthesis
MEGIKNRYSQYSGKIVACIPAFNASKSIGLVVARTKEYVDEVIVVNDGSADDTATEAINAGARLINHSLNLGYGSAISTCLKSGLEIDADIIITLDSDLQHSPEEIPFLVQPIIDGSCDLVIGSRFVSRDGEKPIPGYRRLGITFLTRIANYMADTGVTDVTTGFRAYSKHAAKTLATMRFSSDMGASSQILIGAHRSGLRVKETQVNISYGTGVKTSTQNAISMGTGILTSIIRYVAFRRPLSLIGIPGLAILILGVAGLFLLLDIFNATRAIPVGLGMFTVATVVIGLAILLNSLFLYTLSSISREIPLQFEESRKIKEVISRATKRTSIVQYITTKRPLSLIGIPGLAILILGVAGLFLLLDIFSATRAIPVGLGMFTVATVVIGLILLMTSVILYSVARLNR